METIDLSFEYQRAEARSQKIGYRVTGPKVRAFIYSDDSELIVNRNVESVQLPLSTYLKNSFGHNPYYARKCIKHSKLTIQAYTENDNRVYVYCDGSIALFDKTDPHSEVFVFSCKEAYQASV